MTSDEVLRGLAARGIVCDRRRLLDWAHKGLLPRPVGGPGNGRGRGRSQLWSDETAEQAAVVAELMAIYKNAWSACVALWLLGHRVDFPRFRTAFLWHVRWWAWFDHIRQEVHRGTGDREDLADAISKKAVELAKGSVGKDAMLGEAVLGLFADAKFTLPRAVVADLVSKGVDKSRSVTTAQVRAFAKLLRDDLGAAHAYSTVVTASEAQWLVARDDWWRLRRVLGDLSATWGLDRPEWSKMSRYLATLVGSVVTILALLLRANGRGPWLDETLHEVASQFAALLPDLEALQPAIDEWVVPKIAATESHAQFPVPLGLANSRQRKARRRTTKARVAPAPASADAD